MAEHRPRSNDPRRGPPGRKPGPGGRKPSGPRGGRRGGGGGGGRGGGFGKRKFRDQQKRVRPDRPLLDPATLERGPASRYQALRILVDADGAGTFVDQLLDERIAGNEIATEDKHLVQEIVFGAIRHRNTLDQVLDNYLQFPMKRQHAAVRWALRLAAYQLVYLSRIPHHAAIHGTIEALKAVPGMEARDAGFVNAVLRKIQNDIEHKSEEEPADPDDPAVIPGRHGWCRFRRPVLPPAAANRSAHLALKFSHPKWLIVRWVARFGEADAKSLCVANNRVPRVSAILTLKAPPRDEVVASLEAAGVEVEPGIVPEALRLRRTGDVRNLEAFQRGWIRIQDETASSIGRVLEPPPGSRVLDLCAAPGGKAAQLLEMVGPQGHVVACDVDGEKLVRLRENLERVGTNFTVTEISQKPGDLPLDERFSHILVDVPCSNTGVLARRPEARWRIHGEDLATLAAYQLRILDAGIRRLAPGGRLVYATCSIEPEENGQVVAAARRRFPQLVEEGSRLFLPHRDGADGGYYAILVAPREGWPPASA